MMNFGNFGWGWIVGGFLMIVFWVAIIAVAVWAVQRLFKTGQGSGGGSGGGAGGDGGLTPLEIAKRRYARGEITKEQFEQLKRDLS